MSRFSPESTGRLLVAGGWAVLLAYFPSGWMHQQAGSFVYLRDVLLALHLFACLVFFSKNGQLPSFLTKVWPLAIVPLFLLPALFFPENRIEMGGYVKWSFIWFDCIALGRLVAQFFQWNIPTQVLAAITALTLLADLGTGYSELQTGTFAIPMRGQLSPLGVEMGKDTNLKHFIRIKGLQRDVFSFANLMGLAVVAGACLLVSVENLLLRIAAGIWIILFCAMLFQSGGRSAFFGVGAALLLAGSLLAFPGWTRQHFAKIALAWLAIGLLVSFVGIGEFTDWFSGKVMKGSHIGDSQSAYMRDDNWREVRAAIGKVPVVLFTGSPLGSLVDSQVQPIFHWADNNYLWLLYHGSFISLAALILYFRNVLSRPISSSRLWGKDCLLLFLLFVMGEAIARESLSFLGCVPLFIACGYVEGVRLTSAGATRGHGNAETLSTSQLASQAVSRSLQNRRKKSSSESMTDRLTRRSGQPPANDE